MLNPLSKPSDLGMTLRRPDPQRVCPRVSAQEVESSDISSRGSHGLNVLNCKNQTGGTPLMARWLRL